jgi:hypothetical protein
MAGQAQCKHVKPDGTSCAAKAMASGWCWFHDASIAAQRDEARQRGARQTRRRRRKIALPPDTADLPLSCAEEVIAALAVTFNDVRKGAVDARVGNCLGLLAGTLLRAFQGDSDREGTAKPAPLTPPLLTPERVQRLLDQVRARHGLPPVGPKELTGPGQANGDSAGHDSAPLREGDLRNDFGTGLAVARTAAPTSRC